MATCRGTATTHCCWVDGQVCPWFDPSIDPAADGLRCLLRRDHDDWPDVYADPRYVGDVAPMFERIAPGRGCGDWPFEKCNACGATAADQEVDL